jgi:hypothetical protein
VLYHGVLASQSKHRQRLLPRPNVRRRVRRLRLVKPEQRSETSRWASWAELLERVFGVHRTACPHCVDRVWDCVVVGFLAVLAASYGGQYSKSVDQRVSWWHREATGGR